MKTLTQVFNATSATVFSNQVVCFDSEELDNTTVLKILNDNGYQIEKMIVNSLVYYVVSKVITIETKSQYITTKTLKTVAEAVYSHKN